MPKRSATHLAKRGDRYAAVQAVGMAVRDVFGQVSPGAARGVALGADHGSAFLAEHFHKPDPLLGRDG